MAKFPTVKDYVRALSLVDMLQPPITEFNTSFDKNTGKHGRFKHNVFYRVRFELDEFGAKSKLKLDGFAITMIDPAGSNEVSAGTLINAEDEFMENREFWVGDIKTVFDDYNVSSDKQKGSLVWAATPYRLNNHKEFFVNLEAPAIEIIYPYSLLEELDIYAKPAPTGVVLNHTCSDTIHDVPPEGLIPTGLE